SKFNYRAVTFDELDAFFKTTQLDKFMDVNGGSARAMLEKMGAQRQQIKFLSLLDQQIRDLVQRRYEEAEGLEKQRAQQWMEFFEKQGEADVLMISGNVVKATLMNLASAHGMKVKDYIKKLEASGDLKTAILDALDKYFRIGTLFGMDPIAGNDKSLAENASNRAKVNAYPLGTAKAFEAWVLGGVDKNDQPISFADALKYLNAQKTMFEGYVTTITGMLGGSDPKYTKLLMSLEDYEDEETGEEMPGLLTFAEEIPGQIASAREGAAYFQRQLNALRDQDPATVRILERLIDICQAEEIALQNFEVTVYEQLRDYEAMAIWGDQINAEWIAFQLPTTTLTKSLNAANARIQLIDETITILTTANSTQVPNFKKFPLNPIMKETKKESKYGGRWVTRASQDETKEEGVYTTTETLEYAAALSRKAGKISEGVQEYLEENEGRFTQTTIDLYNRFATEIPVLQNTYASKLALSAYMDEALQEGKTTVTYNGQVYPVTMQTVKDAKNAMFDARDALLNGERAIYLAMEELIANKNYLTPKALAEALKWMNFEKGWRSAAIRNFLDRFGVDVSVLLDELRTISDMEDTHLAIVVQQGKVATAEASLAAHEQRVVAAQKKMIEMNVVYNAVLDKLEENMVRAVSRVQTLTDKDRQEIHAIVNRLKQPEHIMQIVNNRLYVDGELVSPDNLEAKPVQFASMRSFYGQNDEDEVTTNTMMSLIDQRNGVSTYLVKTTADAEGAPAQQFFVVEADMDQKNANQLGHRVAGGYGTTGRWIMVSPDEDDPKNYWEERQYVFVSDSIAWIGEKMEVSAFAFGKRALDEEGNNTAGLSGKIVYKINKSNRIIGRGGYMEADRTDKNVDVYNFEGEEVTIDLTSDTSANYREFAFEHTLLRKGRNTLDVNAGYRYEEQGDFDGLIHGDRNDYGFVGGKAGLDINSKQAQALADRIADDVVKMAREVEGVTDEKFLKDLHDFARQNVFEENIQRLELAVRQGAFSDYDRSVIQASLGRLRAKLSRNGDTLSYSGSVDVIKQKGTTVSVGYGVNQYGTPYVSAGAASEEGISAKVVGNEFQIGIELFKI
ncbi:MAG TPA: hypothetical protein VLJ10_01370, partial [Candidatus Bathyarchaeia archaeon]|nr:hypothetical protein [Candidatus Bathyarchaeia archaeon]